MRVLGGDDGNRTHDPLPAKQDQPGPLPASLVPTRRSDRRSGSRHDRSVTTIPDRKGHVVGTEVPPPDELWIDDLTPGEG